MKRRQSSRVERAAQVPGGTRACITALDGGTAALLDVRAQPGAKRSGFAGFWRGMPKIAVSAPPEKGRANDELATAVAALFRMRASGVSLHSGATSRAKKFRLACTPEQVEARLKELEAGLE